MFKNLNKKFEAWITRWKTVNNIDDFLAARIRLTFLYTISMVVILVISNIVLYHMVADHLAGLGASIPNMYADSTLNDLFNHFLMVDAILLFLSPILGFLLSRKTLQPIKDNLQKQRRFIIDASHSLRTPIEVMISGLESSLHNKELNLALAKRVLENTLNEMRDFSNISNNLLDISKYGASAQIDYEIIYIGELVRYIIEKNSNLAQAKDINIETKIGSSVTVWGNKIELSRVLYNILDNAINYIPPNGTVSISDEVVSDKYVLTISDDGDGIPKKIINEIFNSSTVNSALKDANGKEFGLSLSKTIIENHKGTLSIESKENKGTTVTITLPVSL